MIRELRRYECLPGKLPAVVQRFRVDALPIWSEIGFRPLGFWTTVIGDHNEALHYMLSWNNLAEREEKWQVFASDTRWIEIRKRTEANGPLVARIANTILRDAIPLPD
ncbi:NIPSNAP family protein [Corticibacterium sp. UT-5YL-CI-8]|nr:NIPSNAP family protein [Tianweitania sp. UT-5YL-CI-8]